MLLLKKGFAHLFLVVIIAIGGVGALGYYAFKSGQIRLNSPSISNENLKTAPSVAVFPSESPAIEIPSDWETYTSPKKDYSFKHPKGLKSDTGAAGSGFESIRFSFMGEKQKATGRTETNLLDGYSFVVTKFGSTSDYDAGKEAQKAYNSSKENCLNDGAKVSPVVLAKVDGQSAYQYQTTNCFGDYTMIYTSNGKDVFSITLLYIGDNEDLPGYKKISEQIFSTFQFLNIPNPDASTPVGWNTRTFDGQAISIYLPLDWTASIEDFPDVPSSLIRMKKKSWAETPVQLDIKANWDNTGDAKDLAKNSTVGQNIPAARVDSPKKEERVLERYQSNVYFEKSGKVYIFTCVHNWETETLNTCNTILQNISFEN